MYFKQGKPEKALAVLEEWVEAQPESLDPRLALVNTHTSAGRHAEAAEVLAAAVQHNEQNAPLHALLGQQLRLVGRVPESVAHFRRALELNPKLVDDALNLAWIDSYARLLAASPDPAVRNGAEAVRWAENVCKATRFGRWETIDTLAAAYAEACRFEEASSFSQQILASLQAAGHRQAADAVRARLAGYRSGQPLREQAGTPARATR